MKCEKIVNLQKNYGCSKWGYILENKKLMSSKDF